MQRHRFGVWIFALLFHVVIAAPSRCASPGDALAAGFANPPDSAKPHTWWHWINGNVTREGITHDLEAMKRIGLGGFQLFNVSMGPVGPVKFMSPEWRSLTRHAISEADRLGLEVCLHNGAGWSSSGGPWNTPENAMQMVTWSESQVDGSTTPSRSLPRPLTRLDHYRDIAVVAFPTPDRESRRIDAVSAQFRTGSGEIDASSLFDGDPSTTVTLNADSSTQRPYLAIETPAPFRARSLTLVAGSRRLESGELQVYENGNRYTTVVRFGMPHAAPPETEWAVVIPFAGVEARKLRLVFGPDGGGGGEVSIAELILHDGTRIDNLSGKAAYTRSQIRTDGDLSGDSGAPVTRASVIDLTRHLRPDGRLDWQPPAGRWTVLRIGHTAIGRTNHPAPEEGTGLECDKLSRVAVKAHFDGMMTKVLDDAGPLAGKTLNNVLIDSYETGPQNWTPRFREEFRARRGYDLVPWLPTLTGRIVEDRLSTERFLWDFRRTIADLWEEIYYRYFRELARGRGLILSTEGYGNGIFDNLTAAGRTDLPMGEYWSGSAAAISTTKEAASAAHAYGLPVVGAEAFTTGGEGWKYAPADLKTLGDAAFALGINRYIYHTSAHQPYDSRRPGYSLGPHGLHFHRHNTLWEPSRAWVEYASRCQFLLQQGRFVADVCALVVEDPPADVFLNTRATPPKGYDYDFIDTTVLRRMSVRNGRLVLPNGMSYRVLTLPDRTTMTPRTLRKVRDLVRGGAVVVGPKPVRTPGLSDAEKADAEVRSIAGEVWGDVDGSKVVSRRHGKGRIVWGQPMDELLRSLAPPDFEPITSGTRLSWIHRRNSDSDLYFVSNQRQRTEVVECAFRVAGKLPEFWHPDTGLVERAAIHRQDGGRSIVTLRLDPGGSVFVVFRKPAGASRDSIVALRKEGESAGSRRQVRALEIRSAVYGILSDPARRVDVTDQIRGRAADGNLYVEASNSLAGDPALNVVKELRIDFSIDGESKTLVAPEGSWVDLPETTVDLPPTAELSAEEDGTTILTAWEAGRFVVEMVDGKSVPLAISTVAPAIRVVGPWEVRFPVGSGAPERIILDRLISWTEHGDPGVRHFSGTATCEATLTVPSAWIDPSKRVVLDLGQVKEVAEVSLNGESLGILWKPPYRLDPGKSLRAGQNRLRVLVTNTWTNRLIGDSTLPADRRITWTTYNPFGASTPLVVSGLIGPVTLRAGERKTVEIRP